MDTNGRVTKADFVRFQAKSAPSQVGIASAQWMQEILQENPFFVHEKIPPLTHLPVLQAIATAIFFLQTLGLIMQDSQFFGVLQALNFDVEEAAGRCISPLTTTERFYAKVSGLWLAGWPSCT